MNQITQLGADIAKLWGKYASSYLSGVRNTLVLALVATVIGCIIGFICGVLNTIPHAKTDNPIKRFVLALIRVVVRIYVEVFRGIFWWCPSTPAPTWRRPSGEAYCLSTRARLRVPRPLA